MVFPRDSFMKKSPEIRKMKRARRMTCMSNVKKMLTTLKSCELFSYQ